ncbi:MAG: ArsR family transcriptional regulator [Robiginitomaculum sp.]|nr:ArsR family transcriptional regulator [Robiginitomaculum sp.]
MTNNITALSAIAHEGRLILFRLLVKAGDDGLPAGELSRLAKVNITTSSAQLSVLANAKLVTTDRVGRSIIYRANYKTISNLLGFLMADCCLGREEVLRPLQGITSCCADDTYKKERLK